MAISSGSYTFGAGGTYATLNTALNDIALGGLTGNITLTQSGSFTETVNADGTSRPLGGFTLHITNPSSHGGVPGVGYIISHNTSNASQTVTFSGTGLIIFEKLQILNISSSNVSNYYIINSPENLQFNDNLIDSNDKDFQCSITPNAGNSGYYKVYNNMMVRNAWTTASSAKIQIAPGTAASNVQVYNNIIHMGPSAANAGMTILMNTLAASEYIANNVIIHEGSGACYTYGGFEGSLIPSKYMHNNAATDGTLSGSTLPKENIVAATEFASLVYGNADYLKPTAVSILKLAGTNTNKPASVDIAGAAYGVTPPIGAFVALAVPVVVPSAPKACSYGHYSLGVGVGIGLGLGSAYCYGAAGAGAAGSASDKAFQLTVKTDNAGTSTSTQFTLPLDSVSTYDFNVDWGDGNTERIQTNTPVTHEYGAADTYQIRIGGDNKTLPHIYFNNGGDRLKLLSVDSWGDIAWDSFDRAFYGCTNAVCTTNQTPNTTNVTSMAFAFALSQMNPNLRNAIMSSVTSIESMYSGNTVATPDTELWDTSSLTNAASFVDGATLANPKCNGWDWAGVTTASNFARGSAFDTTNYDLLLLSLDLQTLQTSVAFHAGDACYSAGGPETARTNLILNDLWIITDNGPCNNGVTWLGTTSASAADGANWSTGLVPQAGEVIIFDDEYNNPCTMNQFFSVGGVYIGSGYTNTITHVNGIGITTGSAGWYQVGGTYNASADLTGNWNHQRFLLYAGSFSAPLLMKASAATDTFVIQSGATFTHNNGTLQSTGSASEWNVNGKTLYNVIGFADNSFASVNIQSNMDVVNKFHNSMGTLSGSSGVVLTLQGDLQLGNSSGTNTYGLVVELNGTGAQEVYKDKLGATGGRVPSIRINKSAGTVTFWDELKLFNASGLAPWDYIQGTVDLTTNSTHIQFNGFAGTVTDATTQFYDVTIKTSNVSVETNLGAALNVANNLIIESVFDAEGYQIDTGNDFTIQGSGNFSSRGNTNNIGGNLYSPSGGINHFWTNNMVLNVTGNSDLRNDSLASSPGNWFLNVTGTNVASNSLVTRCDASGGTTLTCTASSNGGGNINVVFV